MMKTRSQQHRPLTVSFLHPDLGLGGAERLVVDAAVGLQGLGHTVTVYTSHHDPGHAFKETTDGTLRVVVAGDWLPRHVLGRLHILFATLRALWLAMYVLLFTRCDVFFVDQISIGVPLLRWMAPVLFYCHYPDQLLARRGGALRELYRLPFDALEQATTGSADAIAVNSAFTKSVFVSTFTRIPHDPVKVVYPGINFEHYPHPAPRETPAGGAVMFLSINRFERKKNLGLAIQALAEIPEPTRGKVRLTVAGGYDPRVRENVEYLEELKALASSLGLADRVAFKPSFSEKERHELLSECHAVLYTPQNEHFGLVPVEAMYSRRPVIAVASGGPLETVVDGQTGYLCEGTPQAFARAMTDLARAKFETVKALSDKAHEHAKKNFSLQAFTRTVDLQLAAIVSAKK